MDLKRYPDMLSRPLPISTLRPNGGGPGASDGMKNKQSAAGIAFYIGDR